MMVLFMRLVWKRCYSYYNEFIKKVYVDKVKVGFDKVNGRIMGKNKGKGQSLGKSESSDSENVKVDLDKVNVRIGKVLKVQFENVKVRFVKKWKVGIMKM